MSCGENSLNTFIRFAWNDSFPSLSHYICSHSFTECWLFGLLRKVSSGSRAKTATLSLLYQTRVKSTNRLLWPNVIKLQPGSGQFTVRQFCLSRVSCISTEQKLSILPFKKKKKKNAFITIKPGLAESCGITPLWGACLTPLYSWWLSGSDELRWCSSCAISVWGPSSSSAQKKSQLCVLQHICAEDGWAHTDSWGLDKVYYIQ